MILVAIVLVFDVALRVLFGRRRSILVAVAFVVAVPVEILREDHEKGQRFLVALVVVFGRRRSTLVAVPVVAVYGWRRRRRCRHPDEDLLPVGPDVL